MQLCRRLADVAPFPERLRAAIVTMCSVPGAITSLTELAQSASLAPRTVHRAARGSELVSLNLFVQASLLLHAWPALRNPLHSRSAAARASGLTTYQTETYPVILTGRSLAELRAQWPSDSAILDAIEQRLRVRRERRLLPLSHATVAHASVPPLAWLSADQSTHKGVT